MTELEKDIERKLKTMVERHGGLCLKWVCPGQAGVPDRIVLLPGGHALFVELKRPQAGKVSKLQLWWAKRLHKLDFDHWIVWDDDDLHRFEELITELIE